VDAVLLPDDEVGIGAHRVVDAVASHGLGDGRDLLLSVELPAVDADDLERLTGEALRERPQHREAVDAVHAARGPEVEEHHPASERIAEQERSVRP